jgi:hypothetical protein
MVEGARKNKIWKLEKKAKGFGKETEKVFLNVLNCFGLKRKKETFFNKDKENRMGVGG